MQTIVLQPGETRQIEGPPLAKMAQVLGAAEPDLAALSEALARDETEPADADASAEPPERLEVGGGAITIKADAAGTGGLFGYLDYEAPPDWPGPPPHRHRETVELFYVLEGGLTIEVDGENVPAPAGTFVMVAPGTAHKFSTTSGRSARFLVVVTPGGLEEYFRELARAIGDGPVDPAVAGALIAKYDFEPA
jgi:mannose-6-phosphate isomerase-like protein (cupin superfamily)